MLSRNILTALIGLAVVATSCTTGQSGPTPWTYGGSTGPSHWADLDPAYSLAATGERQSPIDLSAKQTGPVGALATAYKPTAINIVNNGHAIQVNYDEGSSATIGPGAFDLLQFHFHSPSEHTVDGKHHPIEMHLVHKNADGKLAVVSAFFKEGKANPALAEVWSHLAEATSEPMASPGATVNVADLLPSDRTRYVYSGSLTTPPCSEDVSWMVLKTPVEASAAQIKAFQALYDGNNRPTQPLHGRVVKLGK